MNLQDLFENNEPTAMAQAVTRRILSTRSDLLSRYGVEAVSQAIDDVTGDGDWEEIGSSDVSAYVRYVEDYLRDHHGSREEMADRKPFAEQGVSEGFIDTIKGAAKELTRDSLQKKIKQAWENTFWPRHVEPALNRIQIDGRPFRKMVLGEPRMIENDRSQRALLKQYTVNIVFPIDPQDWSGDEIRYLEGQLQDIQDGAWNPKVQGLGLVSFDQPMKSFQYTRSETPDLVIPVRITSLDINRGLVGEQGVAENQRRFNNVNDDDLYAVDPRTKEIIAHLGNPYNNRTAVLIKKRQHEQQGHEVMSGMRAKFNRDVNEQQIQEDRVVPVVVIGSDNKKIDRRIRIAPGTKDPILAIMRYYARQGQELYSVNGQRVGAGALAEADSDHE
jgi:hypothetical protein